MAFTRQRRRAACWLAVAPIVATLTIAAPAAAAGDKVTAVATPAVAYIGSQVEVSGSTSPHSGSLTLQAFSAAKWTTVAHGKADAAGHFALAVKAPRRAVTLLLRVSRAPGKTTSHTVRVRVVTKAFSVKATTSPSVASGGKVVVTGQVSPKAGGSVWLQRSSLGKWHNVVSAKLVSGAKLRLTTTLPAGSYALRVARPYTAGVAGGVSKTLHVTVAAPAATPPPPPPTPPVVTTAALPPGTAGFPYAAQLTASGGVAPLTWAATFLPAGLAVSAAGAISGAPTTALASTVTVTVTDSLGRTASAALALTVAATSATSWGANSHGQLGDGTTTDSPASVVAGLANVTSMAGGSVNGYASLAGGSVWAWGDNDQGQLGDGSADTTDHVTAPVQVSGLTGVTSVVSGRETGYALRSDGTVWAWGFNGYGNLGNGTVDNSTIPVQVSSLSGVTAIAAGGDDGYALKADGTVWAWGINTGDELGDGSATDSHVPVQVSGLSGMTAIAAGVGAAYALKAGGTVWSWGSNPDGELGDGTMASRSTPVQASGLTGMTGIGAGATSGYAVGVDGRVWAWGGNGVGQLGTGGRVSTLVPTELSSLAGVVAVKGGQSDLYALEADGSVWVAGYNGRDEYGPGAFSSTPLFYYPGPVHGLAGVVAIGAGASSLSAYAVVRS